MDRKQSVIKRQYCSKQSYLLGDKNSTPRLVIMSEI